MEHRILIVDDSAFARRRLRETLPPSGYIVDEATSGPEALEKYSLHKPHLVFLDMVMEGMDGLEVLTRLRAMDPHANIIVATADVQSATRDEVLRLGANGIINKPFNPADILAAVQRVSEVPQR